MKLCVMECIKRSGINCAMVALSSIDVYSAYARLHGTERVNYQPCPVKEDMALRTELGVEGEKYDKLGVEVAYLAAFSNINILRLPALYGWPDTTRVERYLEQMLCGSQEIIISRARAAWKFSRCLHKNAAYATALCITNGRLGANIYNVAEDAVHSELEWCKRIGAICGWKGIITQAEDVPGGIDFSQDFYVSSEKIRSELGFVERYSPDEGLADTVAFYAYQRMGKTYKKYY